MIITYNNNEGLKILIPIIQNIDIEIIADKKILSGVYYKCQIV